MINLSTFGHVAPYDEAAPFIKEFVVPPGKDWGQVPELRYYLPASNQIKVKIRRKSPTSVESR